MSSKKKARVGVEVSGGLRMLRVAGRRLWCSVITRIA
jgi:hypothetical protein